MEGPSFITGFIFVVMTKVRKKLRNVKLSFLHACQMLSHHGRNHKICFWCWWNSKKFENARNLRDSRMVL